jgi:excisionase family DNA binding protein
VELLKLMKKKTYTAKVEKIQPAYLKPREAAIYLSVSVSTLYSLKGEGIVKFYKLGGAILLKVSDLDAAVEKGLQ